jgi:pimeloyl-ACP methyl ester carboxylesterase
MQAATRYARSGDVHIAYRVFGSGPRDLVLVPGTVSHAELFWELPANAYLLRRLARFARVIVFDKRGQGLSDRVGDQSLDERIADLRAVLDATGSERAGIYGWSEGGQLSLTFAAAHPERVSSLILYGSYASIEFPRDRYEAFVETMVSHWGEGVLLRLNAPSRRNDAAFVDWFGKLERAVASPGSIRALMLANYRIDVRHLLPAIRVPTLIFHRAGDALVPVAAGRLLAERIPGARYVELPGGDHLFQSLDQDLLERFADEVEEFVTGARQRSPEGGSASAEAIAELERYREVLAAGQDSDVLAAVVARANAIVAAARGAWSDAEADFLKAAETFRRHGMLWQEAHTFRSWGHAMEGGPDRSAAIRKLDTAIELLRDRGPTVDADAPGPSSRAVFRREADYWTISSGRTVMRLKDAKGLHYIAYLLARPGCEVFAGVLATLGTMPDDGHKTLARGESRRDLGDAGPLLDAKAREQYRRRIADLDDDLEEAVRLNDTGRAERLRAEVEAVREQVAAAVGFGARDRKAASHAERARLMVTKAIKTALEKIRANDRALGRHLATSITTGTCCVYDPGPDVTIAWEL